MNTPKNNSKSNGRSPLLWIVLFSLFAFFLSAGITVVRDFFNETKIDSTRKIAVLQTMQYRFRRIYNGPDMEATRAAYPAVASATAGNPIPAGQNSFFYAGAQALPTYSGKQTISNPASTPDAPLAVASASSTLHAASSASATSYGGGVNYTHVDRSVTGRTVSRSNSLPPTAFAASPVLAYASPLLSSASPLYSSMAATDAAAGGPRRVDYGSGTTPPSGGTYSAGDTWTNSSNGEIYVWNPENNRWEDMYGDPFLETPGDPLPIGNPLWPLLLMAASAAFVTYRKHKHNVA